MPSQDRGFTLTEILVSMGIIALLTALLIPAVSRTMEMANSARCISHLKAMGVGFAGFAMDHQNELPASLINLPPAPVRVWYWDIAPYIPTEDSLMVGVFNCPSAAPGSHCYGYDYFAGTPTGLSGNRQPRLNTLQNAYGGKRWLVMDSHNRLINNSSSGVMSPTVAPRLRHGKMAHVLLPDLSVQSLGREELNASYFPFVLTKIPEECIAP